MGERKVLNKYIPADFDPKLVPRGTRPKGDLVPVRMMLPFSMQCLSCSTFLYRGRKFNSKKEPVKGPKGKYLGIQRFRLYIKCSECSRPITFLTDPENADYEMETGATRNYDVHHDKERTLELEEAQVEAEEKDDPLKALENRVEASKREMADMDNLEEILAMNQRHAQIMRGGLTKGGTLDPGGDHSDDEEVQDDHDDDDARNKKRSRKDPEKLNEFGLTEDEEALVQSVRFGQPSAPLEKKVWRLQEDDEEQVEQKRRQEMERLERQQLEVQCKVANSKKTLSSSALPSVVVKAKRKRKNKSTAEGNPKNPEKQTQQGADIGPQATAPNGETKATLVTPRTIVKSTLTEATTETSTTAKSDVGSGGGLGGLLGDYGSDDSD